MSRFCLLLLVAALAGCQSICERHYPGPEAAGTTASADKPGPVTAVIQVRPNAILAKLGLGAKGKAAALYKAWAEGMGVPLDTVKDLTLVCTAKGVRSARVETTKDLDRKAVQRACGHVPVTFENGHAFQVAPGPVLPLDERVAKQMRSVGKHDVVVWVDGSVTADLGSLTDGMKLQVRDGTLAIDFGDTTDVAARLNFKDEAAAVTGAKLTNAGLKMGRMYLLQITAMLDLADAFPGMVGDGADKEKIAMIKAQYGLLRDAEPALLACKAVPRGAMVPLYLRAVVPAKKLGELVWQMDAKSGCDKSPDPGLFFGPKPTATTVPVARPTPAPGLLGGGVTPVAHVPAAGKPAGPDSKRTTEFTAPPGSAYSRPMEYPAEITERKPGVKTTTGAGAPPPLAPRPQVGSLTTPAPLPPTPTVPQPLLPPSPTRTLTVANVMREDVTIFTVEGNQLRAIHRVHAGEAIDLLMLPGQRLAVTYGRAPFCTNYTVQGTAGEVWLLRPPAGSPPAPPRSTTTPPSTTY